MDKLAIAMLGQLPKERVKEIIDSLPEEEREELALSPDLDLCGEVCYEVLAEGTPDIRESLANNPETSKYPEAVKKLAEDEDWWVRIFLAQNTEAIKKYPDVVHRLVKDEDEYVRRFLAQNPEIGKYPEVMNKLAEDEKYSVRQYLAMNPVIGEYPEVMNKLAEDEIWLVRKSLAENPAIGEYSDMMKKLVSDKYVREALCTRENLDKECPECMQICEEYGYR